MKQILTSPCKYICSLTVAALLASVCSTMAEPLEVGLLNPTFKDQVGDGVPDAWETFPGGDGLRVDAEVGGVRIEDRSTSKGLGIAQWVSAQPGQRYELSVDLAGEGGLFAYLTFLPEKPKLAKDIQKRALKEKRVWMNGGGQESRTQTLSEVAPAGTKLMRIWIYSPSSGTTNVRVTGVRLTTEALEAPQSPQMDPGGIPEDCLTQNPSFSQLGVDGFPVDWEVYPASNGKDTHIAVSGAGLRLADQSKKHGLGITQWIPVEAGQRYLAQAHVEGVGGLFLYSVFNSEKPAQKSRYHEVVVSEKRKWAHSGKVTEVAEVAPEGAKWMRVWLYSPGSGTCDITVKSIVVRKETLDSDAAAFAAGLFDWFDFETGDFSQISTKEGAKRAIVKRDEGPVREGDYAYQATLLKSKERSEITGARSPAYGVARYGWSLYVPENFDANTFFTIVTQWHDWGSGKKYPEDGGAPTHLYIAGGHWRMKLRHQGEGHSTASEQFNLGPIEGDRGKWTDWVLEINLQAPGDGGWMKPYKNDKLVADYEGTTWYEGKDKGPYYKMGLYRGSNKWPGTEERSVLYFDAFRMAIGEDSTYEQVAPSTYSKRPD